MEQVTLTIMQHDTEVCYILPTVRFSDLFEFHKYEHNAMQLSILLRPDLYVLQETENYCLITGEYISTTQCTYDHGETHVVLSEDYTDEDLPF